MTQLPDTSALSVPSRRAACRARPRIVATNHCRERFAARQFDGLDSAHVRSELDRVLNTQGKVVSEPPRWVDCSRRNDAYLVVGPTVFPLQRDRHAWVAVTCLHRDRSTRQAAPMSRAERLLAGLDAAAQNA